MVVMGNVGDEAHDDISDENPLSALACYGVLASCRPGAPVLVPVREFLAKQPSAAKVGECGGGLSENCCEICHFYAGGAAGLRTHLAGAPHGRALARLAVDEFLERRSAKRVGDKGGGGPSENCGEIGWFYPAGGGADLGTQVAGAPRRKARARLVRAAVEDENAADARTWCRVCGIYTASDPEEIEAHLARARHWKKLAGKRPVDVLGRKSVAGQASGANSDVAVLSRVSGKRRRKSLRVPPRPFMEVPIAENLLAKPDVGLADVDTWIAHEMLQLDAMM